MLKLATELFSIPHNVLVMKSANLIFLNDHPLFLYDCGKFHSGILLRTTPNRLVVRPPGMCANLELCNKADSRKTGIGSKAS